MLEFVIFSSLWFLLFLFAINFRKSDVFGNAFLLTQFIFVGFGVLVWPLIRAGAIKSAPTYDLTLITDEHVINTNFILLLGVFITYTSYQLVNFISCTHNQSYMAHEGEDEIFSEGKIRVFAVVFLLLGLLFIITNFSLLLLSISLSGNDALQSLATARQESSSSYLLIITVYNLLPGVSFALLILYLRRPSNINRMFLITTVILTASCLLLTFQKRPLLVYFLALAMVYVINKQGQEKGDLKVELFAVINKIKSYLLYLFSVLIAFYYYYTSYRFEYSFFETVQITIGIAISRVIGRLSIPALMYSSYYPDQEDHYGTSNVGLFAKIFGNELYYDARKVSDYFSLIGDQGTVATSSLIDFYGSFGLLGVVFGSLVMGLILAFLNNIKSRITTLSSYTFFVVIGIVIIYYLSQASVFRTMLSYGGVFYLSLWFVFSRKFKFR